LSSQLKRSFSSPHPEHFCLNAAPSKFNAEDFYAASADFFPVTTDFCSLNISAFIASKAAN
jgi:hypothetical protein